MKMSFKKLDIDTSGISKELIVYRCLREYLPKECGFFVRNIHRVYGFTYAVKFDINMRMGLIKDALVEITIPVDRRKRIEVAPCYRDCETHTVIGRKIVDEYVIINIKEYQNIDTDHGSCDILIGEHEISFGAKDKISTHEDYYSLYVDECGIIRLANREDIREDIIYINPDITYGDHKKLYPGYVRKSIFCRGSIDYAKRDRIVINALMYNAESTKYCLRRRDSLFLPEKYMDHIRQVLDIRRWG